jgi:Family of unknown function (DUF6150)
MRLELPLVCTSSKLRSLVCKAYNEDNPHTSVTCRTIEGMTVDRSDELGRPGWIVPALPPSRRESMAKVYIVHNAWDADEKVYTVDNAWDADEKIYIVDRTWNADRKVYMVDRPWDADKKVYIVCRAWDAD